MRLRCLLLWFISLNLILAVAACRREKPVPQQRYQVRGKVVYVDKRGGMVTLAHEAIQGYMGAMTMGFVLKDQWAFDVLKPGQSVQATLVVEGDNAWLEEIVISQDAKAGDVAAGPPNAPQPPAPGAEVPDFRLINQDGKPIHLRQYRGEDLLLTFIYTRCPLPDYCPLLSRNFAKILDELQNGSSSAASVHLLSISIDPDYDKPAVLRTYAREYASQPVPFQRWEFATGTPEQVRKVAGFFGLSYWDERGQIVHSLVTVLIGSDGKVRKVYRGNQWQPSEVLSGLRNPAGS